MSYLQAEWELCPWPDCKYVPSDVAPSPVWWECGLNRFQDQLQRYTNFNGNILLYALCLCVCHYQPPDSCLFRLILVSVSQLKSECVLKIYRECSSKKKKDFQSSWIDWILYHPVIFPLPTEIDKDSCGDPGTPLYGYKEGNGFLNGDVLRFKCQFGFELIGERTITCQNNNQWSANIPICICKSSLMYFSYDSKLSSY